MELSQKHEKARLNKWNHASADIMIKKLMEEQKTPLTDSLVKAAAWPRSLEKDVTGAKYLKMENSVSFSEMCSYVIELPVSEHGRPEVKMVKKNEIKNLMDYNTFKEVIDEGHETIRSRWVITVKEKHNGQKQQCQPILVK